MVGKCSRTIDFCLWVTVEDHHLVPALADRVFSLGHQGQIIAVSDGPVNADIIKAAGCKVIVNPKQIKSEGSEIIHRNYSQLLENSKAEGFIQIDPDSAVWWMPPIPDCDWAGQLINHKECIATWGCGAYHSRRLLSSLIASPITETLHYEKGPSCDLTMAKALNAQGFYPQRWMAAADDRRYCIDLGFSPRPTHSTGRWAITHPHR